MADPRELFDNSSPEEQLQYFKQQEAAIGGGGQESPQEGIVAPEGSQAPKTATPDESAAPPVQEPAEDTLPGAGIRKVASKIAGLPGIRHILGAGEAVSEGVTKGITGKTAPELGEMAMERALKAGVAPSLAGTMGFMTEFGVSTATNPLSYIGTGIYSKIKTQVEGRIVLAKAADRTKLPESINDPTEFFPEKAPAKPAEVPDTDFGRLGEMEKKAVSQDEPYVTVKVKPEQVEAYEKRGYVANERPAKSGMILMSKSKEDISASQAVKSVRDAAGNADQLATAAVENPGEMYGIVRKLAKAVENEREVTEMQPLALTRLLGRSLNPEESALLADPQYRELAAHLSAKARVAEAAKQKALVSAQEEGTEGSLFQHFQSYIGLAASVKDDLSEFGRVFRFSQEPEIRSLVKSLDSMERGVQLHQAVHGDLPLTGTQIKTMLSHAGFTKTARSLEAGQRFGWDQWTTLIYLNDMSSFKTPLVNLGTSIWLQPLMQFAQREVGAFMPKRGLSPEGMENWESPSLAHGEGFWFLAGTLHAWSQNIKQIAQQWSEGGVRQLYRELYTMDPLEKVRAAEGLKGKAEKLESRPTSQAISTENLQNFLRSHPLIQNIKLDPDGFFKPAYRLLDAFGAAGHTYLQLMEGGDRFGYAGLRAGAMWARAFREIHQSGRKFDSWQGMRDEVDRIVTSKPQVMLEEGDRIAIHDLYREPVEGRITSGLMKASSHPSVRIIAPFLKIGVNMGKASLEQFPILNQMVKSVRDDYSAGGARAQYAQARTVIGGTLFGSMALAGAYGHITGYGPTEPTQRKAWLATNVPYAIRIRHTGDSKQDFIPIQNFLGHIGLLVGAAADVGVMTRSLSERATGVDYGMDTMINDTVAGIVGAVAHNLTDNVFTHDLFKMYDAITQEAAETNEHWIRRLGRYAEDRAKQLLPLHSLGKSIMGRDKEVSGMIEELQATYWSRSLADKLDFFGVPEKHSLWNTLSPLSVVHKDDPYNWASEQIDQHAPHLKPMPTVLNGERVTGQEVYDYKRIRGQEVKINGKNMGESLMALKDDPRYQAATNGPDGGKADWLSGTINGYSDMAVGQLARTNPKWLNMLHDVEHAEKRLGKQLPEARRAAGVRIGQ